MERKEIDTIGRKGEREGGRREGGRESKKQDEKQWDRHRQSLHLEMGSCGCDSLFTTHWFCDMTSYNTPPSLSLLVRKLRVTTELWGRVNGIVWKTLSTVPSIKITDVLIGIGWVAGGIEWVSERRKNGGREGGRKKWNPYLDLKEILTAK